MTGSPFNALWGLIEDELGFHEHNMQRYRPYSGSEMNDQTIQLIKQLATTLGTTTEITKQIGNAVPIRTGAALCAAALEAA